MPGRVGGWPTLSLISAPTLLVKFKSPASQAGLGKIASRYATFQTQYIRPSCQCQSLTILANPTILALEFAGERYAPQR